MHQLKKNTLSLLSLINLSLMFCLPFMVSYHKWPEPNYYNQAIAIVLGLLSLLVFFKPSSKKLSFPVSALVPVGLSLLLVIQWFSGIGLYWQETMLAILYLWWGVLLMLSVARLKDIYGLGVLVRWLAYALLFGGVFNVLVVLMQLSGADHFFWTFPLLGKSYSGNLAQVNHLTDYLSISLVSLFYLFLTNHLKVKAAVFLLVLFLVALSLTGSRMSWLYILMVSVSFYFFGRNSDLQDWKNKAKYILLMPFLYGLIQFSLPSVMSVIGVEVLLPPVPVERVVTFAGQHSTRLDLIKEGLDVFSAHPLLGVGWGQYVWYDLLYADTHVNHQGFITHTHNLFVQLLAECGIFAGLILLTGCLYWLMQLFAQKNSIERWWVLLVAGIIFMHSMLEYPLWYAYFLGVFVVVVALGDKRVDVSLLKPFVPSVAAIVILAVAINLVVATTQQYRQIEYWINVYPKLSKQQRFTMLNELSDIYQTTLIAEPLHMVLTRAYSLLPRAQAPLKAKIAKYEAVMHYVQADQDIYRYILLLAADGQQEKSIAFLKRAYVRQPSYAKTFAKQLEKGASKGNPSFLALQAELAKLQRVKE